jgi:hypothetical protein
MSKHRLQISVVIEDGRGSVIITKQSGRKPRTSTAYVVRIEDAGGEYTQIAEEERVSIDEAILIRKAVRAAVNG